MNECKLIVAVFLILTAVSGELFALEEDDFPARVKVQPLFYVPKDQNPPTREQILKLHKHINISSKRFKQMLSGQDTFEIADYPKVVQSNLTLEQLKNDITTEELSVFLLSELFSEFNCNRFNCPYVFFVVLMNPDENWPGGSGRPINPGFNGGGGIAMFSSKRIDDKNTSVQGSIQHELGHAFGLTHVSAYGYNQRNNRSIMSYEKTQIWNDFQPPPNPSILIPEDIRALAMNKRVFPNVYFDSEKDVPEGYTLYRSIPRLGIIQDIPGQPPYEIKISTTCGQEAGTKPENIVMVIMRTNRKGIGLAVDNMWMSGIKESGWIDLYLDFPIAVRMNRIRIHSQCGGGDYPITGVRVEANDTELVKIIKEQECLSEMKDISFKETKAKQWHLYFLPGQSKQIVIRGLDFYSSKGEFFCRNYPLHLLTEPLQKIEQNEKGQAPFRGIKP